MIGKCRSWLGDAGTLPQCRNSVFEVHPACPKPKNANFGMFDVFSRSESEHQAKGATSTWRLRAPYASRRTMHVAGCRYLIQSTVFRHGRGCIPGSAAAKALPVYPEHFLPLFPCRDLEVFFIAYTATPKGCGPEGNASRSSR